MSKKRTSPEHSNDEQTIEGSDSVFQQDEDVKRAKLTTLSDTTLQDLPMEVLECILVKAVAMEAMGTTRAKSVWKENAHPVMSRLGTVCSQWSAILTTDFFRNELQRTFDAQEKIRLEILHQFPLEVYVCDAITFKDELFILCRPQPDCHAIHVYDRNNVAEVRDVIPLPGIQPTAVAACSVSNCLYILNNKPHSLSLLRITKTDDHQFNISPLISALQRRNDTLSVAANGNLVLAWQQRNKQRAAISVYGPNGHLRYETWLSSDSYEFFYKIIPKSNGNFVLVSPYLAGFQLQTKLTEIDMTGTILRQYQSSLFAYVSVSHADLDERIVLAERLNRVELLDSEFNLLQEFNGPQLEEDKLAYCEQLHYNRERDEVAAVVGREAVTIFHFTEE